MADTRTKLVIIGSGWAGFYLAEYVNAKKYAITIISPRRTSAYTPLLASAACGLFNFYLAEEPIRSKSRNIRFVKANVEDISFPTRTLHCRPAFDDSTADSTFTLTYDKLVLAPGCDPNTFNTPGVPDHAIFLKNVSDAMAVRKLLFDLLEKASLPNVSVARQRELLHIAIVGGGPTGIEVAAELHDLAHHEIADLYPDVAANLSICIHDVAPNILSAYDAKLHEYAHESLLKRKIEIRTASHITHVEGDALYTREEGRIPCGMLIWATGNKNVPLVDRLDVKKTEKGLKRILTDDYLRVYQTDGDEIFEDVYAIGDAADVVGAPLPTTAEVAVQKAKFLTKHFNDDHLDTGLSFKYQQKALVSYIGGHDGVIGGRREGQEGWTGKSAWVAWRSGSLMWTRNWRGKIMICLTWILNAVFGKEIARM